MGYAGVDIVSTIFRVVKNYDMPELLKLEFIKACLRSRHSLLTLRPGNRLYAHEGAGGAGQHHPAHRADGPPVAARRAGAL